MAESPVGLARPCGTGAATVLSILIGLLPACGSSPPHGSYTYVTTGCTLLPSHDSIDATWPLSVAIERHPFSFAVPQMGFPVDLGQRFTAAQVSETLIRLDCRGDPVAGLADSWSVDATGLIWTFTLRSNARFSDGTLVTAGDVTRSFAEVSTPRPWGDDAGMLVEWAGIRSARLRGDSVIMLEFIDRTRLVPSVLAHPALVTVKPTAGEAIGSGPFSVSAAAGGRVRMVAEGGLGISLTMVEGDTRDALDAGIDLVVTRDPRALAYAAGLEEYRTLPMPWQDVYTLLQPMSDDPPDLAANAFRLEEIVQVSARTASSDPSGQWWWSLGQCRLPDYDLAEVGRAPRLVYDATDVVARNVAERLAALEQGGGQLVAEGLSGEAFWRAVHEGGDWGYIVRLPLAPVAPCLVAEQVLRYIPWFPIRLDDTRRALTPLVETRSHALARAARVAGRVETDWNGALVVVPRP